MTPQREITPRIGSAVVVSHFDRHHVVHTTIAHVLAIAGWTHQSTPDGIPALTVAFPDPAADPTVLQGPNFSRAYRRETGVVHHTHPEAHKGHHSMVWGHPVDEQFLNDSALLDGPKHSAANPIFDRHQPESIPAEIPQGIHGAPALRSESDPLIETKQYADGTTATGVAPLPDLSPEEQASAEAAKAQEAGQPIEADLDAVTDPAAVAQTPSAPQPAQDAAIDAADENAHNAAVAAEVADKAADDAAANAEAVHNE